MTEECKPNPACHAKVVFRRGLAVDFCTRPAGHPPPHRSVRFWGGEREVWEWNDADEALGFEPKRGKL